MHFESIDDHVNLLLSSSKFDKNMEKFLYNPVSINETTRSFFPNIQTLYIYSPSDLLFENDPKILAKEYCSSFSSTYVKKLEELFDMKYLFTLFDSDFDDWSINTSVFNDKINGKQNMAFVIEDEDGNIFGIHSYEYTDNLFIRGTPEYFDISVFSLESKGRLNKPMIFKKYEQLNDPDNFFEICPFIYDKRSTTLFSCGSIMLMKKDSGDESYFSSGNVIDYKDMFTKIRDTEYSSFVPKRIVVLEMDFKDEEKQRREQERLNHFALRENSLMLFKQQNIEYVERFEQLIGKRMKKILFDSSLDGITKSTFIFNKRIENQKNTLFILDCEKYSMRIGLEQVLIGYYFDEQLLVNRNEQIFTEFSVHFMYSHNEKWNFEKNTTKTRQKIKWFFGNNYFLVGLPDLFVYTKKDVMNDRITYFGYKWNERFTMKNLYVIQME